jgi:serine/threonine protein kinase
VYSLGNILFRLICGHEPWNKLEIGGKPSAHEISEKVRKGILPHIPEEVWKSDDSEVQIILEAMLRCYTFDPGLRPSARQIANYLDQQYQLLLSNENRPI